MYSSSWVLNLWANHFRSQLIGGFFEGAISFDKDTLFLRLISSTGIRIAFEIKFLDGNLMILPTDKVFESIDYKKGIAQFKDLENKQISSVTNDPNDRWICIQFTDHQELWFKAFGKFGNVLSRLSYGSETNQIFRLSQKSDWEFKYPKIEEFSNRIKSATNLVDHPLMTIETLVSQQVQFLKNHFFQKNKTQLIDFLEKQIKHLMKIELVTKKRLEEIKTRRSQKEIGDLILAHAHSISEGLTKALITDYYTNQRIWVKLNPDLNTMDNAKKYYRKAKNEVIEEKKLLEQFEKTQLSLEIKTKQLQELHNAEDNKSLKSLKFFQKKTTSSKENDKQPDTLPYRLHEFQGFQIWVGKNNRANDQMLKLSQKNDLWLHAKDVAGSHVIIKKRGAEYPKEVIEFASKLAAQNSKAKTQTVVPVIAVARKFVSKPKNAAPGAVSIQKETIVDAYLS